jgi:hypothetical protein
LPIAGVYWASTEMSLRVLAYTMTRAMKILGQEQMMQIVRA